MRPLLSGRPVFCVIAFKDNQLSTISISISTTWPRPLTKYGEIYSFLICLSIEFQFAFVCKSAYNVSYFWRIACHWIVLAYCCVILWPILPYGVQSKFIGSGGFVELIALLNSKIEKIRFIQKNSYFFARTNDALWVGEKNMCFGQTGKLLFRKCVKNKDLWMWCTCTCLFTTLNGTPWYNPS